MDTLEETKRELIKDTENNTKYLGITKDQAVTFTFTGKTPAVAKETQKSLDSLGYKDAESNLVLGRLNGLISSVLDMCSDNCVVQVAVNIPGVPNGAMEGTDGKPLTFKSISLQITPLWGFVE